MNLTNFLKKPYDKKYRQYLFYYLKIPYHYIYYSGGWLRRKLYIRHKIKLPDLITVIDTIASKLEAPKKKTYYPIKNYPKSNRTIVDNYWVEHLVMTDKFKSAFMSKRNLQWRFNWYPKYRELMELYGDHNNEIILDYGCGPGSDVVGFGLYSKAKKIIGMDVSESALKLACQRLQTHSNINPKRIELILISDAIPKIPLKTESIDYIYSEGVIHHTSNPITILKEFYRILKPGGQACIMVYNYNSVFLHLYIAYEIMLLQKKYPGLDIYQTFTKNTDGEDCPISRCYLDKDFIKLGEKAGFRCEFLGGYLSRTELVCIKDHLSQAIEDSKLKKEHRNFLKNLTWDRNLPMYKGKYAGIGGVYKFYKK